MSADLLPESFEHPLTRVALALGAGLGTWAGGSWCQGIPQPFRLDPGFRVKKPCNPTPKGVMTDSVGSGGLMAAPGGSFRLGGLHPLIHPSRMSPSPELYSGEMHSDLQPLDFSTKKGKMSPASGSDHGENSDSDRCSLTEESHGGDALNLAMERPVWSRSSESGVSVSSTSPDRPISPGGSHSPSSPMAMSPSRPIQPHHSPIPLQLPPQLPHPSSNPSAVALNSTLLSQINSNPLLFSTLQSALSKSKMMGHPFKSYLPGRTSSPPPPEFPHAPSHLHNALPRAPASLGIGGLPGGMGVGGGLGGAGLGAGGLGGSGLGAGGLGGSLLGASSLSMASSNQSSSGGLSALDGFVGGLGGGQGALGGVMGGRSSIPSGISGTQGEAVMNAESNDAYARFREQMMAQVTSAKSRRSQASRTSSQGSNDPRQIETKLDAHMDAQQDAGGLGTFGDVNMPEAKVSEELGDIGDTQSSTSSSSNAGGGTKRRGRAGGDTVKDDAYWERRRKNNEAAKRSRDARRAKEDEIAIRAAFLEQENLKLRVEVASLKSETAKLRCMLYNS